MPPVTHQLSLKPSQPVPDTTNQEGGCSPNTSVSKTRGSWAFCEITHGALVSWSIPHQPWLFNILSDRWGNPSFPKGL